MSYVGAAANVVGGIMQSIAASQEQKAMFKAFGQEQERQAGYRNQSLDAFNPFVDRLSAESANSQLATAKADRVGRYDNLLGHSLSGSGSPLGNARDMARLGVIGDARAGMGSYSDWSLNQAIDRLRTQQALDKIGNFAGGTARVFPYRMYQAQHSMDELDFWGKMIASVGGGQAWQGSGAPPNMSGIGSNANMPGVQGGYDYTMPAMDGGSMGSMFA